MLYRFIRRNGHAYLKLSIAIIPVRRMQSFFSLSLDWLLSTKTNILEQGITDD